MSLSLLFPGTFTVQRYYFSALTINTTLLEINYLDNIWDHSALVLFRGLSQNIQFVVIRQASQMVYNLRSTLNNKVSYIYDISDYGHLNIGINYPAGILLNTPDILLQGNLIELMCTAKFSLLFDKTSTTSYFPCN